MKTIAMEQTTLDACVRNARHERVIITQNGLPVALVIGLEGMDEEQVRIISSDELSRLSGERRRPIAFSQAAMEQERDYLQGTEGLLRPVRRRTRTARAVSDPIDAPAWRAGPPSLSVTRRGSFGPS